MWHFKVFIKFAGLHNVGYTVAIFSVMGTVVLIIITAVFIPVLYFSLKLELLGKHGWYAWYNTTWMHYIFYGDLFSIYVGSCTSKNDRLNFLTALCVLHIYMLHVRDYLWIFSFILLHVQWYRRSGSVQGLSAICIHRKHNILYTYFQLQLNQLVEKAGIGQN